MIELRYPIIEDAEDFFRILTEEKFEDNYHDNLLYAKNWRVN